ncbi:MAG: alpha/beta hydrolase [Rhodocyclaceae bacterium]|nr:alpha/beta hydrolase [Rhodocyclaceae bacterium]
MNRGRFNHLEVLVRSPQTAAKPVPLLFVHGAYAAAWCWDEHFLPWFARAGYASYAVSLSGHGESRRRDHLDSYSINDYVDDLAEVIAALPAPPVLIGHSMGGMVVQKYLERAEVPGAVLMASVPPQGLFSSAMGVMFSKPGLLQDLNHLIGGGRPSVSSVREALFHQEVSQEQLVRFSRLSQPESHRAIWDMTMFNLPNVMLMASVPMLVLGAEYDQMIAPALVSLTARTFGVREEIFKDMGHAMMLEQDWQLVAERIHRWLGDEIG